MSERPVPDVVPLGSTEYDTLMHAIDLGISVVTMANHGDCIALMATALTEDGVREIEMRVVRRDE